MPDSSSSVRIILKQRRAQPFFGRHPWVFDSAVDRIDGNRKELPAGTAVEVWSAEGAFIAHGLWNAASNIRVRLYSWDRQRPVDESLLQERLSSAVSLRRSLFDLDSPVTACRLVFSEGDQLSGLTVDRYGNHLLVQFTSLALYEYRDVIVQWLQRELSPEGIWLRTEKGMREAEGLDASDGLVCGQAPPRPLFIEEHGVRFGVDVQEGQKTGYYLDQRNNRPAAARYMRDASVLDAFCFSGGFGITAAKLANAATVLGIDSSAPALTLARQNADLNEVGLRCTYQRGDVQRVLAELAEQQRTFDAVVLDPPRMARSRSGLARALKGYRRLNLAGLQVLKPGGILVTCSCSGLVSRSEFLNMLADVSRSSGRFLRILEQHGQPADHPVSAVCPETEYLKMVICQVE